MNNLELPDSNVVFLCRLAGQVVRRADLHQEQPAEPAAVRRGLGEGLGGGVGEPPGRRQGPRRPYPAVRVPQVRARLHVEEHADAAPAERVRQGAAVPVPLLSAPHQAQEQPHPAHPFQAHVFRFVVLPRLSHKTK